LVVSQPRLAKSCIVASSRACSESRCVIAISHLMQAHSGQGSCVDVEIGDVELTGDEAGEEKVAGAAENIISHM
jgi:hypothetical protein